MIEVVDIAWDISRYLTEVTAVIIGVLLLIRLKAKDRQINHIKVLISIFTPLFVVSYFIYKMLGIA